MTYNRRPLPGQPAAPIITDATIWAGLLDMLAAWRNGEFDQERPKQSQNCALRLLNEDDASTQMERRIVRQLINPTQPLEQDEALNELARLKPVFTSEEPVWASKMDNLSLLHRQINGKETAPIRGARYIPVEIENYDDIGNYVMIDPDTPTKLKRAGSGIYKIVATLPKQLTNNRAHVIVDTQEKQPLWMYEVISGTTVKLLDIYGQMYVPSMTIADPLFALASAEPEDRGFCIHVDNSFFVIRQPLNKLEVCDTLCDCVEFYSTVDGACLTSFCCGYDWPSDCEFVDDSIFGALWYDTADPATPIWTQVGDSSRPDPDNFPCRFIIPMRRESDSVEMDATANYESDAKWTVTLDGTTFNQLTSTNCVGPVDIGTQPVTQQRFKFDLKDSKPCPVCCFGCEAMYNPVDQITNLSGETSGQIITQSGAAYASNTAECVYYIPIDLDDGPATQPALLRRDALNQPYWYLYIEDTGFEALSAESICSGELNFTNIIGGDGTDVKLDVDTPACTVEAAFRSLSWVSKIGTCAGKDVGALMKRRGRLGSVEKIDDMVAMLHRGTQKSRDLEVQNMTPEQIRDDLLGILQK